MHYSLVTEHAHEEGLYSKKSNLKTFTAHFTET